MILVPKKSRVDLEMNTCMLPERNYDGFYDRHEEDNDLWKLIAKKKSDFEADPTEELHRFDLERICDRVTRENIAVKEANKALTKRHEWKEPGLPYADATVALISGIRLLLGQVDMATNTLQAVDKHVSGSSATDIAAYLPRYSFDQIHE